MKPGLFLSLAAACCLAQAAPPAPAAASSSPAAAVTVAVAAPDTGTVAPIAAPAIAAAPAAASMAPAAPSAGASLLNTVLALGFVVALLLALAWVMKRYGPRASGGNAALRIVGSLSLGGRERIMVIEVADQWIVVGAAPGRVNALATLPRQTEAADILKQQNGLATANFSEWLKQTIEKRNGK